MREWENASWAAGRNQSEVIRRVGQMVARLASQLTRAGDSILLLAGKGHNGDDVRATFGFFSDRRVELFDATSPEEQFATLGHLLARKPAFLNDEVIATVILEKVQGARSFYETLIKRGEEVLAEVKSSWCCIDADTLRPARIAADIADRFFSKKD